ncbi:MAG: hypothetical protein KJ698_08750 [Actinobacteria bacterium]|nr:hypothetical protein [Actinomycetota bacterium]MBU1493111.1 hypothetical protein [Actinomycetota bacterium]MBU1865047.1 hypothetical protein [Actinomycetota bacterium]
MEFTATPEFLEVYMVLDAPTAECVDAAIRRVLAEPDGAWARQNRVVGDRGSSWLIALHCLGVDLGLYWWQAEADSIELLLLLRR